MAAPSPFGGSGAVARRAYPSANPAARGAAARTSRRCSACRPSRAPPHAPARAVRAFRQAARRAGLVAGSAPAPLGAAARAAASVRSRRTTCRGWRARRAAARRGSRWTGTTRSSRPRSTIGPRKGCPRTPHAIMHEAGRAGLRLVPARRGACAGLVPARRGHAGTRTAAAAGGAFAVRARLQPRRLPRGHSTAEAIWPVARRSASAVRCWWRSVAVVAIIGVIVAGLLFFRKPELRHAARERHACRRVAVDRRRRALGSEPVHRHRRRAQRAARGRGLEAGLHPVVFEVQLQPGETMKLPSVALAAGRGRLRARFHAVGRAGLPRRHSSSIGRTPVRLTDAAAGRPPDPARGRRLRALGELGARDRGPGAGAADGAS